MVAEIGFEPMVFGLWARRDATSPLRDVNIYFLINGGGWGIRTLECLRIDSFQDCSIKPDSGKPPIISILN